MHRWFWVSRFGVLHPSILHRLQGRCGGVQAEFGGGPRTRLRTGLVVVVLLDQVGLQQAWSPEGQEPGHSQNCSRTKTSRRVLLLVLLLRFVFGDSAPGGQRDVDV